MEYCRSLLPLLVVGIVHRRGGVSHVKRRNTQCKAKAKFLSREEIQSGWGTAAAALL
jgi:hypothetical protein